MSRALGRYELLRPLARGGMGEVYLARRRAAGVEKWLVVKRMRPERAGDSRFLDLFMREARLSMSLTHQNIVPVFDFGRIDDQVFLAMERVEGKDLGSSLARAGTGLPPLLAAFIAGECLQALDYAHGRKGPDGAGLGIVHRDVTPRNVLLSWAGEVKLTDFGIAVLAGDVASKATGTPAYMAPEQARGEALDVRADVYAVGLVLREALTGVRGRRGNERETVLDLAKTGELEPWPPGIDEKLRAIADRATAVDKAERFPDARAMLEELDRYIVAERAANQGDAPARQVAAWLGELWKGAREEEESIDARIDADVLVSFIDDGALDVMGSGTQRSALATAADQTPLPGPLPTLPEPAKPDPAARSKRAVTEAVTPLPPPRSKRRPVMLLALAGVAIGVILVLTRDRSDKPVQQALPPPPIDARMEPPPDADIIAEVVVDASVEVVQVTPDAGTRPVQRPRPDAGATAMAPVDAAHKAGTRKVTINSKPTWSNWTVDGGPQHSGVETIELTPGKHTIHFTGNPYYKADRTVTIEVPDRDGFTHVETLEQLP